MFKENEPSNSSLGNLPPTVQEAKLSCEEQARERGYRTLDTWCELRLGEAQPFFLHVATFINESSNTHENKYDSDEPYEHFMFAYLLSAYGYVVLEEFSVGCLQKDAKTIKDLLNRI